MTRTDTDSTVTVKGDGSSIINVYYDRDLVTINFVYSRGGGQYDYIYTPTTSNDGTQYGLVNGAYIQLSYENRGYYSYDFQWGYYTGSGWDSTWNQYTGTRYTRSRGVQWTGLYGQPFSKYGYSWPANDGPWYGNGAGRYMTFLGQFMLPDNSDGSVRTTETYTQRNTKGGNVYFYLQNVDGTWPSEPSATGSLTVNSGSFNFTEKFDNFNVSAYQLNNNGNGMTGPWTTTQNGGQVDVSNASSLGVRYARKSYNVEFYNWSTHLGADQSKYYEASLSGLTTPGSSSLTYPGNESEAASYTFVGWFADPECTTYVSFGTALSGEKQAELKNTYPDIKSFVTYDKMPGHNLPVYAGWKAIRHTVTFDPNGGTIPGSDAGENYVESVLLGQSVRNATASNALQTTYTDQNGTKYELVGWYKQNANGPDTLYNFGDAVTEDITLKAHWRQEGQFYVRYVDENGTTQIQEDPVAYADQSDAKVMGWPTAEDAPKVKDGYVFAGWQLTTTTADGTKTTTTYTPGQTFLMDANQAKEIDGKKYITLKAFYTQLGTTYITYDANEGSGSLADPSGISNNTQANIPLNQTTTLSNGGGFSREGYELVGWNTKDDGSGTTWGLGETVGVNDNSADNGGLSDGGNKLFAIWAPIQKLKKVDNGTGDSQKTLSGAKFNLTKSDGSGNYVNVTANDFYGNKTIGSDGYTVTSNNSTVDLGALKKGSYKLTETEAPAGYVVSTSDTTFTVNDKGVVNFNDTNNASYDATNHVFTITNTPGTPLPNSGGNGTAPFAVAGSALIITAIAGFALRRRSEGRGE